MKRSCTNCHNFNTTTKKCRERIFIVDPDESEKCRGYKEMRKCGWCSRFKFDDDSLKNGKCKKYIVNQYVTTDKRNISIACDYFVERYTSIVPSDKVKNRFELMDL